MLGWKSRVWLYLDHEDQTRCIEAVRQFRVTSAMTLVGAPFWAANGIYGVRSLLEISGVRLALDSRLSGNPEDVHRSALAVCRQGFQGLTVHAFAPTETLAAAQKAARESVFTTQMVQPPAVYLHDSSFDRQSARALLQGPADFFLSYAKSLEARAAEGQVEAVVLDRSQDSLLYRKHAPEVPLAIPLRPDQASLEKPRGFAQCTVDLIRSGARSVVVPLSAFGTRRVDDMADAIARALELEFGPSELPAEAA